MRSILVVVSALISGSLFGGTFHVSPKGDDSAAGTASAPFRTLARARDAARGQTGSRIVVADGTYELESAFELSAADRDLVIEAAEGAKPVVSAGRRIGGWTVGADGTWRTRLPSGLRGAQLYANGQRRERPFLPRTGYYFIAAPVDVAPGTNRKFAYAGNDIDATWPDLTAIEVRVFHHWSNSRMRIVSVDSAKKVVTMGGLKAKSCSDDAMDKKNWYRLENVRAAFGEPGDWYLTPDGELWYRPQPGETPANTEIVLSNLPKAMAIDGASGVTVRGLTFSHADSTLQGGGRYFGQAGFFLPGAVHAINARNVRFERCAVTHVGSFGLVFAENCHGCAATGCEFVDLGAGGLRIGNGSFDPVHPPDASTCTIEDCLIAHGGRVDPVAAGIWIGNASTNRVSHCTIHDVYYSGISCGWDWGLHNRRAHHNVIEWNHIYDIARHVLADLGGIYTLAQQPGTVIRNNYVHDVTRSTYMGVGIYLDECSSMITVTNNIVVDTQDCSHFEQYSARSNLVANNVFLQHRTRGVPFSLPTPTATARPCDLRHNLAVWNKSRLFYGGGADRKIFRFADNLMWALDPKRPCPAEEGFRRLDPCLKLPVGPDLAFTDETNVRSVGFVPFSLAGVGKRTADELTRGLPPVPDVFFPVPVKEMPEQGLSIDFEDTPVGERHRKLWPYPDNAESARSVFVTEETACTGRRSCKLIDGMKPDWAPHVTSSACRRKGKVRIDFAWRLEKGSGPHFEVRQNGGSQAPFGPRLTADGDGNLRGLDGRLLCKVKHGVWFRVTIEFELGTDSDSPVYSVTIASLGGRSRTFADIPYDGDFLYMTWAGFISGGAKDSVYYIDDFSVSGPEGKGQ